MMPVALALVILSAAKDLGRVRGFRGPEMLRKLSMTTFEL
jgi:hypothetical protein